ncbi:MAG: ACP S-malonyltransferase [Candidatus Ozemobacteraceae bacterium]
MNALVFPGQGSQKVGTCKTLVQRCSWAAEMATRADQILERSLTSILFEGPEAALRETVNTQPALFLAESLLAEWVIRRKIPFSATAGHSLGEYAALYAAGAASFEDLLRLVQLRARAMETAAPTGSGAMSAVMMLGREVLAQVCREASDAGLGVCVAANFNAPGQIVISGTSAAVAKAGELSKAKGARRVIPLEVSGPFHSPLMEPAREKLAEALSQAAFRDTTIAIYQNSDAAPSRKADDFKRKLLEQLTSAVRWEDQIKFMEKDGIRSFIELGSGKVLSGLIKKSATDARVFQAEDPTSLEQLVQALASPGKIPPFEK